MPMLRIDLPHSIAIDYDPQAHSAYIRLTDTKVIKTEEEADFINLDLDAKGNLVGIELINPDQISNEFKRAIFEKIATRFSIPALKKIHPEYLDKIYATA